MYTAVIYNATTLELVATEESGTIPVMDSSKYPYYVVQGEWNGVVDPTQDIRGKSENEVLQDELEVTKKRLVETENTLFRFMMM